MISHIRSIWGPVDRRSAPVGRPCEAGAVHDIDSALEVIGARDTDAARLANGLWGAMRAGAAHPRVTRYDVQGVCWGALPLLARKPESAAIIGDRHAAAGILAELLDLLDYPRYADICRGPVTREILDAADDVDRCTELSSLAWLDSGVQPPNTPVLTWGEIRGPVEQAVHAATGRILEEAIDNGLVDLTSRRVEQVRVGLAVRVLTSPAEELPGTWYTQIFDERLGTWLTHGGSQTRRELLVRIRPEVAKPPKFSDHHELPALETLLDACEDGLRLTRNGYLPTALVRDLVALMPACADYPSTGRGESSFPPLGNLRRLTVELGLVRRVGNRLELTPTGLERLGDPESLVASVGEALVARDGSLRGVIQEVVFAVLLLESSLDLDRLLDKVAVVVQEEGWSAGERGLSTQDLSRDFGMLFLRRLHILDVVEVEDDGRRVGLTDAGIATARWALRARVMLREVTG
jgi:hypothetical protein